MGQLEPLVAMALGRSPYDDDVIEQKTLDNEGVVRDGQQYDDRGHPVNPQTRQWMRDYVRASNEVMQAAGIIEDTADVRASEMKLEQRLMEESEIGLKRLEVGRIAFIAGVWGVCGLRRRVMLYQSYDRPMYTLLLQQSTNSSIVGLYAAGLPVLGVYQILDWASYLVRAIMMGPYDPDPATAESKSPLYHLVHIGMATMLLQLRMFGTLQQLHLIPARQLLPSPSYFVPFSSQSPIRWPGLIGAIPFAKSAFFETILPMGLMLGYVKLRNEITARIYAPIYRRLPRPINPDSSHLSLAPPPPPDSVAAEQEEPEDRPGTLRRQGTMDSMANVHHDEESETRLGFEFGETEAAPPPAGDGPASASWSAELRSADPPKVAYHITTFTMLPPLLAADAISLAISELAVLPLEAAMVRGLAWTYQRRTSRVGGTWPGYSYSWQSFGNVLFIHVAEVAVLGIVWAAFTAVSSWLGSVDDDEDEDVKLALS